MPRACRTRGPARRFAPAGWAAFDLAAAADPRARLADWVTAADNPYFARALANRYWKRFLGRGLVDPGDDLRATNPASNPELLNALAKRFVADKYDLKKLVRVICTSSVYRLSSTPNAHNADDKQHFARFHPRRLNAAVLLDAVALAKTTFRGVPNGTRAVQLPDNQSDSYFLSVFGRPDAASACECGSDAALAPSLLMMNSEELLAKVGAPPPRPPVNPKAKPRPAPPPAPGSRNSCRTSARTPRSSATCTWWRRPAPPADELATLLAHIDQKGDGRAAYADTLWALPNTKEFQFNH